MYQERIKVIIRQADLYNKTGDTTKAGGGGGGGGGGSRAA